MPIHQMCFQSFIKVSSKFDQTLKVQFQSLIKLWRCSFKVWSNFEAAISKFDQTLIWHDKIWPNFDETLMKLWKNIWWIGICLYIFLPNFALNKNIHWIPNIPKLRFQHKPCHSDMNMLTLSEIWKCRLSEIETPASFFKIS